MKAAKKRRRQHCSHCQSTARMLARYQLSVIRLRTEFIEEVYKLTVMTQSNAAALEQDIETLGGCLNVILDHLGLPQLTPNEQGHERRMQ